MTMITPSYLGETIEYSSLDYEINKVFVLYLYFLVFAFFSKQ